jgi:hypothetical protein
VNTSFILVIFFVNWTTNRKLMQNLKLSRKVTLLELWQVVWLFKIDFGIEHNPCHRGCLDWEGSHVVTWSNYGFAHQSWKAIFMWREGLHLYEPLQGYFLCQTLRHLHYPWDVSAIGVSGDVRRILIIFALGYETVTHLRRVSVYWSNAIN